MQLTTRSGVVALLVVFLCACASTKRDVAAIDVRTSTYIDNDRTTISTTAMSARGFVTPDATISARHLVDYTSSASVDVTTAATGRWTETRNESEGTFAFADGTNVASVGYIHSNEPDWKSHNVSVGLARDFFQHNITIGLGGSWSGNAVGRADDVNFAESQETFGGALSVVLVFTPEDIVSIGYNISQVNGYQASPYRFVFFQDPSAPSQLLSQAESHPPLRVRHSATVRWNHHLLSDSALRSHLRIYGDDWGLVSFTGGTEYIVGVGDHFQVAAHVRAYAQQAATFYEDIYPERREFMTADRELSTFWDAFVGGRLIWEGKVGQIDDVHAELRLVAFTFQFANFSRLPHREGAILEAAVGTTF